MSGSGERALWQAVLRHEVCEEHEVLEEDAAQDVETGLAAPSQGADAATVAAPHQGDPA